MILISWVNPCYPSRKRPPGKLERHTGPGQQLSAADEKAASSPCGAELWGTGTAALLPSRGAAACNACNNEVSVVR